MSYPNPQDAFPLPPRPNLERYKKLAKSLVKACKSGDPDAVTQWAEKWMDQLAASQDASTGDWLFGLIDPLADFAGRRLSAKCTLSEAQFVIARAHGFVSWPKFAKHISAPVSKFELAAEAIVSGDDAALRRLLRQDPKLSRARSTREHRATLLHYASANGVEGYRQKTPPNIVEIARLLLDAGADVNAVCSAYGDSDTALMLAATSFYPEHAGVQIALLDFLIGRGARVEAGDVRSCFANGRGAAAKFLASKGAPLTFEEAAGIGRLDEVGNSHPTNEEMRRGFFWACQFGRDDVVDYLLGRGVPIDAQDRSGHTGLHHAAMGGQLSTIKLLLKRNAALEIRNEYNGTPLGQCVWSAAHGGDPEVYIPIMETLIAAGANIRERHPAINPRVDALLERYGSHSDPELSWFGEERVSARRRRGGREGS